MKKSDIQITMPMTDYEQLLAIKVEMETLRKNLAACYNTDTHKASNGNPIVFDARRAEQVARAYIPFSCKGAPVEVSCV